MRRCSKSGRVRPRRNLRNPYAHSTAAWPPGQAPTRSEQLELADRALSAVGPRRPLAVVVAHNDTDHAHWHLVVCKAHSDTAKAALLDRSGLRLSKVTGQWEREHGGIGIDNRVRRRQARERYAESVAGRMSRFRPDRRTATPQSKAEQRAAALDAARRRARDLLPLPPTERSRGPADDLEPMASARTGRGSTNRNAGHPRRRRGHPAVARRACFPAALEPERAGDRRGGPAGRDVHDCGFPPDRRVRASGFAARMRCATSLRYRFHAPLRRNVSLFW